MSETNLKEVPADAAVPPTEAKTPDVVATFKLSRLSNAQIQYEFGGTDGDLLGLLHYGLAIVNERMRTVALATGAQRPAIVQMPAEMNPRV